MSVNPHKVAARLRTLSTQAAKRAFYLEGVKTRLEFKGLPAEAIEAVNTAADELTAISRSLRALADKVKPPKGKRNR